MCCARARFHSATEFIEKENIYQPVNYHFETLFSGEMRYFNDENVLHSNSFQPFDLFTHEDDTIKINNNSYDPLHLKSLNSISKQKFNNKIKPNFSGYPLQQVSEYSQSIAVKNHLSQVSFYKKNFEDTKLNNVFLI